MVIRYKDGSVEFEMVNMYLMKSDVSRVISISADGDELDYVLGKISSIPKPMDNFESFTWYGDIARTIILNL